MIEDIGYVDENNIFHKNIIQPVQPPQRKKISYDDLLSNMGIKLINGKLELYNKNLMGQNSYPSKNPYKNANDYYYKMNRTNQNNIIQREPFQNPNYQQQQQQPLSKEQYKQYLRFQYFKQQKEREQINQIKSKKIQFTNPNAYSQIRGNAPNLKFFRFVGQK